MLTIYQRYASGMIIKIFHSDLSIKLVLWNFCEQITAFHSQSKGPHWALQEWVGIPFAVKIFFIPRIAGIFSLELICLVNSCWYFIQICINSSIDYYEKASYFVFRAVLYGNCFINHLFSLFLRSEPFGTFRPFIW